MELELISSTSLRKTIKSSIPFTNDKGREEKLINIYPQIEYQTISGFGGAITESAAYVYSLMNSEQKRLLLETYFDSNNMKYRYVRIPIDSCDFSLSHYEADSREDDDCFECFSFDRMEQYILPMLRDVESFCGDRIEIMLSPWSPPAYMKTNGERNHGGKLKKCYWKRWAEYICRYVEEFKERGFHVTMLTLQNEPKAVQTWDSCIFTATEEKEFLRDFMWPSLKKHKMDNMQIYIWDHNKERALEWAETIIDHETEHMIAGLAFHWYSGDHFEALKIIKERFPDKKLLLSEACIEFSKHRVAEHLQNAQKYAHDIIGDFNSGMSTFLDWNLLLDEEGGPNHAKNNCDAPFLFNTKTHELKKQELQNYLWHFSHFVTPGAVRIGLSRYTDSVEATAFKTKDQIIVILLNRTLSRIESFLRLNDTCAKVVLEAQSICTGLIRSADK